MTIKASGSSLSFTDIYNEFGLPSGRNLGAYRLNGGVNVGSFTAFPLDTNIPTSGPIKFSDFYSKQLNIVVDCYSGGDETRVNAESRYNYNSITIIGGFTGKPPSTSGKRVIINANKLIGSEKGNRNYAALKTGNWSAGTNLELVVGSNGTIIGAGGDGGRGGSYGTGPYFPTNRPSESFPQTAAAQNGGQGSSALAIQYPTTIINQGVIRSGRGGGGGGATGYGRDAHDVQESPCKNQRDYPLIGGGGGAGGSGYPAGSGALGSGFYAYLQNKRNTPTLAGNGTDANTTQDGQGGTAGTAPKSTSCSGARDAVSGVGGGAASSGGNASDNRNVVGPGSGGENGYAIIIDSTGSIVGGSVIGTAADGDTVNGTSE